MANAELLKELGLPPSCLRPNKHDLDSEFEQHPEHVQTVADAIAQCRLDLDDAKRDLAKTVYHVRDEKRRQSETRVLVKDMDAAVEVDPEVRRDTRAVNVLERRLAELNGLAEALRTKTSALKHLSELWQSGYYTTNRSSEPRSRRTRDD